MGRCSGRYWVGGGSVLNLGSSKVRKSRTWKLETFEIHVCINLEGSIYNLGV
jgi:hypothetical protein